jgi:hypothetical protein
MNAAPKQRVFRNEASKPKYFMPDEMIIFEGKYFWKIPPNIEIDVGIPQTIPGAQGSSIADGCSCHQREKKI